LTCRSAPKLLWLFFNGHGKKLRSFDRVVTLIEHGQVQITKTYRLVGAVSQASFQGMIHFEQETLFDCVGSCFCSILGRRRGSA
jgi:hypothetical protein